MNWDLEKLYRGFDDPAYLADFAALEQKCGELSAALAAPEGEPGALLSRMVEAFNGLENLMSKVGSFVQLTLAVEAENEAALAQLDKLMQLDVALTQVSSAFSRFVGGLENLDALIEENPVLKAHAFTLRQAGSGLCIRR